MDSDEALHPYEYYNNHETPIVHYGLDVRSIRWSAFEPPSSITILDDDTDPESTQSPLFREDGTMHPVGDSPLTIPSVSSIHVILQDLIDYQEITQLKWCECSPEEMRWPTGIPERTQSQYMHFCSHPWAYTPPLPLKVTGTGPQGAVTIGDYVCSVAPWLRSYEDEIRDGFESTTGETFPADMKCSVEPPLSPEINLLWDVHTGIPPISGIWKRIAEAAKEHRARHGTGLP